MRKCAKTQKGRNILLHPPFPSALTGSSSTKNTEGGPVALHQVTIKN